MTAETEQLVDRRVNKGLVAAAILFIVGLGLGSEAIAAAGVFGAAGLLAINYLFGSNKGDKDSPGK